jgi:hypothetical protein
MRQAPTCFFSDSSLRETKSPCTVVRGCGHPPGISRDEPWVANGRLDVPLPHPLTPFERLRTGSLEIICLPVDDEYRQ